MSTLSKKVFAVVLAVTTVVGVSPVMAQTNADLQAQIAALLAQIQTLQAQLAGGGAPMTSLPAFSGDLTVGSKGDAVSNLQTFLKDQGVSIYPEGLVTGYFGALTKAALARYQAAQGISPAAGYFGPLTRANVNAKLALVTPGVPGVPAVPGVPGVPAVPTVPPVASGFNVMLDAGNPFGTTVVGDSTVNDGSQVNVEVLRLNFTAQSETKVTTLKLTRSGVSADADFANSYLYEGATRLTDSASVSGGVFTFTNSNGLFTVPAGGSKVVSLKVDLTTNPALSSGKTFTFRVNAASDVVATNAVAGTFPVSGNEFRTASVSDLGKLTIANQNPSGATNVDAGTTNYEAWRFSAASADQNIDIYYVKYTLIGTADYDALQNFKLYVDGVQVGSTVSLMNSDKTLVFDLSGAPARIGSGLTKQVSLRADVMKGSGRTLRFRISEGVDIVAKDAAYGLNIKPNQTDVWTIIQAGGDTTISAGTLTVNKASDSPSSNVALNATGVKLGTFDFKAVGEDIKVSTITLQVRDGANSFTNIKNVKLLAGGTQLGTTVASLAVDTDQAFSAGSSFIVAAGTTKQLEVYADVSSASGAADAMAASDTLFVRLITGSGNAIRQSAGTTLNVPGSNTDANTLTVSQGTLTITKNSSVSNMTVVQNAQNLLIGSWLVSAPSEQGVDINSVTVEDRTAANSAATGWGLGGAFDSLILKSGGTQYGQTISSPSAASGTDQVFNFSTPLRVVAGQSVQIDLYANILSNANATWTDTDGAYVLAMSGTGLVTNSTVSQGAASNGQAVTVSTGATLTVTNESSPTMPDATWLVAGDAGVTLAAWKFAADNTEDVRVTRVEARENAAADKPGNVKNLKIYVDGVQVGGTVSAFTDSTNNTALFEDTTNGLFVIPRNSNKTVVLKADLTDKTNASFVTSGADLRPSISYTTGTADATTNVSAKGATSGQFVTLGGTQEAKNGSTFKVVQTRPVFARCEVGASGCVSVTDGETLVPGTVEVFRFQITAHASEDLLWTSGTHNLRFTVTSNPGFASAGTFELFDASNDSSLATAATGATVNFAAFTTTVPKGTSKTYYVKADISSWTAAGASFQLSIKNAAADVSFGDNTTGADLTAASMGGIGLPLDGEVLVKP